MIALDTNVLVRYLVRDDLKQTESARALLEALTAEYPGFVCREVTVELVWVLERAYDFPRDRIAAVMEGLVSSEGLFVEAADDVARAALRYRTSNVGFSDLMIAAAAERAGALPLYTFDRKAARIEGAALLADADSQDPQTTRA